MNQATDNSSKVHPVWKRPLVIAAATVAVSLLLLVVLLPTLLSTGPGTRLVVGIANRSISGEWSVDDLSLGWASPTRLVGLRLDDPDGEQVAQVGELVLHDLSLLDLLLRRSDLGRITGSELTLEMVRSEDGSANLERALQPPGASPETSGGNGARDTEQPMELSLDLQLTSVRVTMSAPNVEMVEVQAPKVNLKAEGLTEMEVDLQAEVTQGALQGRIAASGGIRRPSGSSPEADLNVEVESMPVAALDRLAGYDGKFVTLLGDRADGELRFEGALDNADLALSVQTPNMEMQLPLHLSGEAIENRGEAQIRLAVGKSAYAAWVGADGDSELLQPVTLILRLNELHLPVVGGSPLLSQARTAIDLAADAVKLRIAGLGEVELTRLNGRAALNPEEDSLSLALTGPFTIDRQPGNLNLDAVVSGISSDDSYQVNLTLTDLPVPLLDQLAKQNGRAMALLGNKLTLTAKGRYPGEMAVQARSDTLRLDAPLTLTEQSCSLRGAELNLIVRPAGYLALVGEKGGTPARPVTVDATVSEMILPLEQGRPNFMKLSGTGKFEATPLDLDIPDSGRLLLQKLQGAFETDRGDDSLKLTATSPLVFNGEPGKFEARVTLSGLTSEKWTIDASLTDVPTSLADQLAGQDGRMVAVIGDKAALDIKGSYPGDLDVTVQGADSKIEAPLRFGEQSWSLRSRGTAQFELDPLEYQALVGTEMGELTQPVAVTLDLDEALVPLVEGEPDWSRLKASLNGRSGAMEINVPQVGPVRFTSLTGSFESDPSGDDAKLSLKSPIEAAGQKGNLDALITLGEVAGSTVYDVDGTFENFPVPLVDGFFQLDGLVTALAGPTATLKANGQYPGSLLLNLSSRSVRASAPLSIDEQKSKVTLTEDLTADIQLEEESTRATLGKMHPILADVVASEKPILLTIQRQGFQLPLEDFAFEKVLAQGTLELGTLRMSNRGWMQVMQNGMAGLLGGRRSSQGTEYLAQFTPARFVISDGRIRTEELWMTAETLATGFVGGADVTNNRNDFTMGILGASLIAMAPQVKSAVEPTQVLEVPLRGPLNQPSPDWKPLITRLAGQMAVGRLGGGDQLGELLGGLGDMFNKRRKKDDGGFESNLRWSPPPAALEIARSMER